MSPNLWQNRTGSERGTPWEYEEQRGSELSAALGVQESFPHIPHCWHQGSAGKGSDCSTCFPHGTVQHISVAAPPEMSCRTHTRNPKTHSGSSGFGCWTKSEAMESTLHMHLLCESQQLPGSWERMGVTTGEVSWVARGLFQRAGIASWHCACVARGLLKPEHRLGQSSFFVSRGQEAQLSPNTLKIRAETYGC